MPRTALIVPVPEAEGYYDLGNGVPPHITVLFPFVDGAEVDEAALRDLLGRFPAFDFVLDRLEHFETGVPWLRPNPPAPFTDLSAAVWERWPDHPPYEGEHDELIPHVTVTREDAPLPIEAHATEVWLIEEQPGGRWERRLTIPLGPHGVA
jgi:2'-5' RNA ligase